MNGELPKQISELEQLVQRKNELLRNFPVICISGLNRLEQDDIEGFSKTLDDRQLLIDKLIGLDDEFRNKFDRLSDEYKKILDNLMKPEFENISFPEWCGELRKKHAETRQLINTCRSINERLNQHALAYKDKIISNMHAVKEREKVSCGYDMTEKTVKNSTFYLKSD
ncbi:MAG: flagellar export chaperone FlgN [Oscillospiraceae bacterium]|nr:flagellar export chaperone FlgN [Oscillospiraceae bacterium]